VLFLSEKLKRWEASVRDFVRSIDFAGAAFAGHAMDRRHFPIDGWDAVAVRVGVGMAEFFGDAGLEVFGDEVLQALGLIVQLFDRVVEDFVEERFDEAMVPDDFECAAAAHGGEANTFAALVVEQGRLRSGKLLQHVGDGRRSDVQFGCKLGATDAAVGVCAQRVDGFQVVIDRLAGGARFGAWVGHDKARSMIAGEKRTATKR